MQASASTSSYTLSSTPPLDSEIWGTSSPSSSPELGGNARRTLIRRKNGSSSHDTPRLNQTQSSSSPEGGGGGPAIHPLSGPTPPTIHTDILGDVSRPNLKRLTTETERQAAESSNYSGSEFTGSVRGGSFDLLRMTPTGTADDGDDQREVEVLIHTIKPNESLAGIALLYGIDLATLRKSNKLWPSDPIHIRTHLYVPLESCKWNKAKENLVRGPGEGQVSLLPKKDKGKGKEIVKEGGPNGLAGFSSNEPSRQVNDIIDLSDSSPISRTTTPPSSTSNSDLASAFLPSTNQSYHSQHNQNSPPSSTEPLVSSISDDTPRILDVVRIPSSQLRFFPKPNKPPDKSDIPIRRSLDYFSSKSVPSPKSNSNSGLGLSNQSPLRSGGDTSLYDDGDDQGRRSIDEYVSRNDRRNSLLDDKSGPRIINDLSTLPPSISSRNHYNTNNSPPRAGTNKGRSKSTIVKLRPPSATLPRNNSHNQNHIRSSSSSYGLKDNLIIGGLKDFFTVPPPPPLLNHQSIGNPGSGLGSTKGVGSVRLKRDRIASSPSFSLTNSNRNSFENNRNDLSSTSSPITPGANEEIRMELTKTKTRNTNTSKIRYDELGLDLGLGGLGIGFDSNAAVVAKGGGSLNGFNRNGSSKKGDKQD